MKFIFKILALLSFHMMAFATDAKHFFSVCAFFKNEARFLKEWIEYYRLHGAEKFYLYNNQSEDDFKKILSPYIEADIVELIDWPNMSGASNHLIAQTTAYRDCISKNKEFSKWIAFIDIDEFIIPIQTYFIVQFLRQFDDKPDVGAIEINWQLYGTSNIKKLGPYDLVTEKFILRAPDNFQSRFQLTHRQIKSIVRPSCVNKMTIHYANLKEGFSVYPLSHRQEHRDFKSVDTSEIRINHYWTKDEDFLMNTKIARRESLFKSSSLFIQEQAALMNQIEDRCIHKYLPKLKQRLAKASLD